VSKIMILGDTHGDWGPMNKLLNKKRPDIVLQCGDFGFWKRMDDAAAARAGARRPRWPGRPEYGEHKIKTVLYPKMPDGCKLYWCDGNHEDHESLDARTTDEFWPNVFYMPRGTIKEIAGLKIMFVGGAESLDKESRKLGIDWFPQEVISMADYAEFPPAQKVDIVISHTCPLEFGMRDGFGKENDCSRSALSSVLEYYQPSRWFFGHWHDTTRGQYFNPEWNVQCVWQAMSMTGCTGWWQWLKD